MNKKTIREIGVVLFLLFLGGCFWVWLASRQLNALSPPSENIDFSTFADQMPPPKRLAIVDGSDGARRIVWIGELAGMSFPSGPSCYVFDETGTLVRWSATTGDGESVTRDGVDAYDVQSVTVQEAKVSINAG